MEKKEIYQHLAFTNVFGLGKIVSKQYNEVNFRYNVITLVS